MEDNCQRGQALLLIWVLGLVTLSWLFLPTSGNLACLNKIIMQNFLPLLNRKNNKVKIIDYCLEILLACGY